MKTRDGGGAWGGGLQNMSEKKTSPEPWNYQLENGGQIDERRKLVDLLKIDRKTVFLFPFLDTSLIT